MQPEKIGRYVIDSEVGRGGMATVYKAYDPHFERWVAVKVLPREFMHEPEFRARFEREAKTIAMLEHPAIVPVYDFGESDGQPYLVMRYMPGGSLAERLQKGPLSIEETAEILQRIGAALERAHSQQIIHRDLKPSNILFDQYGDAFLADFGIVRIASSTSQLTASGSLVGTPSYMSPEQVYGDKELDGRSDIYALGVILFQMLTGKPPYEADTPAKVMMKHVMDPVPAISEMRPDLPPTANEIIGKAMAKERNERFSSATDLTRAVKTLTSQTQESDLATELAAIRSEIAPDIQTPVDVPQPPELKAEPEPVDPPTTARKVDGSSAASQPYTAVPVSDSKNGIPSWVWGVLTGLALLCAATVAITYYLVSSGTFADLLTPDDPFNGGVADVATAVATPTPNSLQSTLESFTGAPPTINATGTVLAEGRFATATAIALAAQDTPEPPSTAPADNAEATREMFAAIRATEEAERGAAAATAEAERIFQPNLTPLVGPLSGSMPHDPGDNKIESEFASVDLQDFMVTVTFFNPFGEGEGWDYGLFFRQTDADNEMRLVIRSDGSWNLNNRQGNEDNFVHEDVIRNRFNSGLGEPNKITVIAQGEQGYFYFNNQFVTVLDLSGRLDAGDIAIATGFYASSEQNGAETAYSDFQVWELSPAFGPANGSLEHIEDNFIKSRNAGVDLQNVIAKAAFITPYDETVGLWDMGFSFRDADLGEQYWLVVESSGYWALYNRQGGEDAVVHEGDLPSGWLNLNAGDVNELAVLVYGNQGVFLVNGRFAATLDLSDRVNKGDVQVFTAFFEGNEVPGYATDYEDFTVWALP
ncbi:MAG: hypothetical protein Kow0080_29240 [Candidatus Promineifilaceae bacterium]